MEQKDSFLEIKGLTKTFGALIAVNKVDMSVLKGELRAIIGPNGAGKTTLFNLISGALKPTSGKILLNGEDIAPLPPYEICQRGIVRTFQITQIFPELTVLENVRLAVPFKQGGSFRIFGGGKVINETERKGEEILDFLGLSDIIQVTAAHLSHGNQRLLELSMALAQDPEILLLDEPTAGLSVEETQKTVDVIKNISEKRKNTIFLLIRLHWKNILRRSRNRIICQHRRHQGH